LQSGSLDLTFAGGSQRLNDTDSSFDPIVSPFNLSTSATITGSSLGAPKAHTLTFGWTQQSSTPGSGDPSTIRLGQESRLPNDSACTYSVPPRPQAPDGHWVTVTVTSVSGCGDGIVDVGEDCDEGASNGQPGSCCTTGCAFELPTMVCRSASAGDVCDVEEFCTGSDGSCPADAVAPASTVCRSSAGVCDPAETCDGVGKQCPGDQKSTGVCRSASDVCDVAEVCDGVSDDCPIDQFEPSSQVCRTAAGVCDVAETCTGSGPSCPTDTFDIGTLCRSVAGVCDVAEFCSGASADCPTDQFEPSSVICRSASAGNACDVPELCTGSSATCPADAVAPVGTVCRASAGTCDVEETCNGVDKQCPSDQKSTAECRAAAGVCDVAEVCDGVGDDCPADQFAPSSQVCRASAGECDVAELCDGISAGCPVDGFETDGTLCTDDGLFCTGVESCLGGACASEGNPCGPVACDEGGDVCVFGPCPIAPDSGCLTSAKSILLYKDKTSDSSDKLIYKWVKGQSTTQGAFADPLTTAGYDLCFYAGTTPTLIYEASVPPSATNWKTIGSKGFKYKDRTGSEDGAQRLILKASSTDRSKALWKGKGANLPEFSPPLPIAEFPLTVQLHNDQGSICVESTFDAGDVRRNEADLLKLKD
jgi:hypothetical protein